MNVMFATKDFPHQAVYGDTKEITQETNLMNVMSATKDFPSQET